MTLPGLHTLEDLIEKHTWAGVLAKVNNGGLTLWGYACDGNTHWRELPTPLSATPMGHVTGMILVTRWDVFQDDSGELVHRPYFYHSIVARQRDAAQAWGKKAMRAGAAGRPSAMDHVLGEHARRQAAGTCSQVSRKDEGEALSKWLKEAYADAPALSAESIRNKLPDDYQPHNKKLGRS